MFLACRFNYFDFAIATIFSKSSSTLLITSFVGFFSRDMCQFISSTILKRLKFGSLGLHQKILKLCFLNMSSLSFSSSES